ncbi:MAG TPA: hypothetical protein VF656_09355 [Pyrinomonadaceae bacterium]|jgi:hypothetical protein
MSDDKATTTKFDREAVARGATHESAPTPQGFNQAARRAAAVGVYERPSRVGARLSLPLVVILILSALVSIVAAARFLF